MTSTRSMALVALGVACLSPCTRGVAQTAITCPAPAGKAPGDLTVASTAPTVTLRWSAVPGARSYAVLRRNPDGSCWNLSARVTGTSWQEALPAVAGTYQYQVAAMTPAGSGVSQAVPLIVGAPAGASVASRTLTLTGFTAIGPAVAVASRTFSISGFTATGPAVVVTSRSIALAGFSATGPSVAVASRTITLAGYVATGPAVAVASRTVTLTGFTASGSAAAVASRTFTLAGWTSAGQP